MSNLALLCPTCHKMLDLDLISTEAMIQMRDRPRVVSAPSARRVGRSVLSNATLSRRISLFDHRFVTTVFQAATVSELLHLQAKTDWLHSAGARIQERDGGVYAACTWKDQTFFGFCNAGNEFEP